MKTQILPDAHFPMHSKTNVGKALDWTKKHRPQRVVIIGDWLELHALSMHRQDPRWQDNLAKELDSGKKGLEALRKAARSAEITYIRGNHELRMETYINGRIPAMRLLGIDIPDYLDLDKLGIKWHTDTRKGVRVPCGQGQVVSVFHGHESKRSSKYSAGVALAMAEKLGKNVICGHTHKLGLIAGVFGGKNIYGAEAGHLINARHKVFEYGGINPQWTAGFMVCDSENRESPYPRIFRL